MPEFMPGLELSEALYLEAIQPLMAAHFPALAYSAARLDWGSDVLGFDTPMSMDHGWGPKMTLFLKSEDFRATHKILNDFFANHLPLKVRGFPTHFSEPYADGGVMQKKEAHPVHHMITITTVQNFFREYLGVDINNPITPVDWLTIPQQKLRTLRAGQIYHDGLGLASVREGFRWYPRGVWLYLMAVQWQRINQDEPFIGRTGQVGDELGSMLLGSRLIREMMHLAFLIAREYAPYTKWLGKAFQQLPLAAQLSPYFHQILESQNWKTREEHLNEAYLLMAKVQNELKITPPITPEVTNFHGRPFLVPHSARFVEALLSEIVDPAVKHLPKHMGNVDQISDNTDVLENPQRCRNLIEALLEN
jgi:hypothetical protein